AADRQTGLVVTAARQHGVLGDLIDPAGNVLARGLSVISLRPFKAGNYLLRVYDPFGAAPQAIPFSIEMSVPAAGETPADADRDADTAHALSIGHTAASTGLTRPFFASQLAQIRQLDASGRQIADLTGLEQLINLESLDLAHNNLAALDFIEAPNIHHGL